MALVPKRGSGRTGRRRLSEVEASLRGAKALYEHHRLYGRSISANNPMPPAPTWFTEPMLRIWDEVVTSAPVGVLHRCDHANVVVLVRAIHAHQTLSAAWLAYQTAAEAMLPPPDLERRVRLAGAEVNRASMVLGLTPGRRSGGPEAEEPDSFRRFTVVRPDA